MSISAYELLVWNDVFPDVRMVEENTPAATRTWMIVADYGWAERILCSGCYETDAEALVAAIRASAALAKEDA